MLRKKSKTKPIILAILVVFVALFFVSSTLRNGVSVLWGVLVNRGIQLKKTNNNINILLLGIGGGKHEGPDLSDTIIFASIKPSKNEVDLVSLPRDLWVNDLSAKINTAYATGQEKDKKGILLARAAIEKVVGEQIDYTVVVDFSGFVKVVDLFGGIDVSVARTFDDYAYPIEGRENDLCGHTEEEIPQLATASSELEAFPCRYTHVHFDRGESHMDGATALTFVRSRHAEGAEGSDFARSERQHKVIEALKNKVFSIGTILNPIKVIALYGTLRDNINTDIESDEFDDFIRLVQKMQKAKIVNYVIDTGDESENRAGLLVNPPLSSDFGGQWVVIPRLGSGNFSEIHEYVACIIKSLACVVTQKGVSVATPTPSR